MATVGPVCHIPPKNNTAQPAPADLPGIPPAAQASLASLQHTVNQLRQIIIVLTGQQGARGPAGLNGANAQPPQASQTSFTQKNVSYTTTKIFQNNDPTTGNFVEVQTVANLVMSNKQGATWTYNAPPPAP